ncbi:MAG: AAA family ATPase [Paludibacteraceae bacterium]|nr:AAA family ATPase [Paludibacteraceae bacterium]
MKVSHSRISTFLQCPYKYKLKYKRKLETIFNCDPQNPLIIGHALHTCIEKGLEEGINEYFSAYPIIDDLHINEAIKLKHLVPRVLAILPKGEHEVEIADEDYIGYIDLLVPVNDDEFDIYDFKYSNNVDSYLESEQLHLYKYYFEKQYPGKRIRDLKYVFIPKTMIRQKKKNKTNPTDESLYAFRKRIIEELKSKEIVVMSVDYDPNKVIEFLTNTKHCIESSEYAKNQTRLCDWCEYQTFCEKGEVIDLALPKNERVAVGTTNYMKGWIYGPPFSGKTTFLDNAPDPLNLNTDGNTKYVTMQRIRLRDEVWFEGRQKKTKMAWEILKETIEELEMQQNDFKTIIVDLVEDTREMCRLYMYDKYGWEHETDGGFGKGWDVIKTEYLSTMRRLLNLDYNVFLVSHEDTSKDITKGSGDKVTRIAPNIQEGLANKLAGMVDFVGRVVIKKDDSRVLSFKTDNVIFGGGRLHINVDEIPLDWDELVKVYEEANRKANASAPKTRAPKVAPEEPKNEDNVNTLSEEETVPETTPETQETTETVSEEEPVKKTRKRRA